MSRKNNKIQNKTESKQTSVKTDDVVVFKRSTSARGGGFHAPVEAGNNKVQTNKSEIVSDPKTQEKTTDKPQIKSRLKFNLEFYVPLPLILGVVQFLLIPIMSGVISSLILTFGLLEKLQLHKYGLNTIPTITIDEVTSTNYQGLRISVAIGFIIGWIILNSFRLVAQRTPLFKSDPSKSAKSIPIPSVMTLIKLLIHLAALSLLVFICSSLVLKLAEMQLLPFVVVDKSFRIFEMTSAGVVTVAALGCLLVFICDTVMTFLRRR